MEYRQFGKTDLKVSAIGFGCWEIGGNYGWIDESQFQRAIQQAIENGITCFDTAEAYGMGVSEQALGRVLGGRRRDDCIVTKFGVGYEEMPTRRDSSRQRVMASIEKSLQRLQTDHVDVYLVHWPDPDTPLDETMRALDDIVQQGKARYIGVSNFLAYRLARALGRSDVLRAARFVSVQPRYNLLFRQIERELLPLADEEGLAVIPYNPLAGGLLTGKHRHDAKPTDGRFTDTVGKAGAMYSERYWHEREFKTIETLREINAKTGEPMTKTAIAWVLANPTITSAIISWAQKAWALIAASRALASGASPAPLRTKAM